MVDPGSWPLGLSIGLFLAAAAAIGVAGVRLAGVADRLADRTGLGEAITGAVFLGATTSLSGSVTSITAAWNGHAGIAIGNAIGGIAAQTAFLGAADVVYRKANLEHAAASIPNLVQAALLVTLLSIPLVAMATPPLSVFGFHPASVAILVGYALGLRLVHRTQDDPMWGPRMTGETRTDEPDEPRAPARHVAPQWLQLAALMLVVGFAGWLTAKTAVRIAEATGLSHTIMGALFTAISTSLPELVTTVAAVRRGALTLAVGGIIGGNTFDVLMFAGSDFFYRRGSIYHALDREILFLLALTILLTGILILGLLRREKHGIWNIGFESFLILTLYFGSFAFLWLGT